MDHNHFATVEQQAIELVSSLGKEHLFVANCPSDIDADKYSSTVITYEEAFDHSDAGVGLCLLLPKAFVLQKFVDISFNKNISVHFVFTCPSNTSEFEAAAWLYNLLQDKVQHIGFMQNLGTAICPDNNQENILLHAKLNPVLNTVRSLGPNLAKPLNMFFPELLLNVVTPSVNYRTYLLSIALTFDDPMDVTVFQIRLMSPLSQFKLITTALPTLSLLRKRFNQPSMLLGCTVSLNVR